MKRARLAGKQTIGILKVAEAAGNGRAACREHNITEQTFYLWRREYGGLEVSEARKIRELARQPSELELHAGDARRAVVCLEGGVAVFFHPLETHPLVGVLCPDVA